MPSKPLCTRYTDSLLSLNIWIVNPLLVGCMPFPCMKTVASLIFELPNVKYLCICLLLNMISGTTMLAVWRDNWHYYSFCYQHIANLAGNKKLVLPVPAFNVINGGSHAGNKLAMQACLWCKFVCECLYCLGEILSQSKKIFWCRNSWFFLLELLPSRRPWRWVWKSITIWRQVISFGFMSLLHLGRFISGAISSFKFY